MSVNSAECEAANLEEKEVARITKGFSRYIKQANDLGLIVFGGSGTLSLRFDDGSDCELIVSDASGNVSGGCGSEMIIDGLIRGE